MLNLKDFASFMIGYGIYVLWILFVFTMLIITFRHVLNEIKSRRNNDLEICLEDSIDSFGNHQPLKKYIVYKGTRYYLEDMKLYNRFNRYYVIIGNKRVYINY